MAQACLERFYLLSSVRVDGVSNASSSPQAFRTIVLSLSNLLIRMEGADSCGISGTGETPQALWRRGGSPPAPRKAKQPGMDINGLIYKKIKERLMFHSAA
ncbi:hypothetical protein A3781_06435 [Bacillus badius]|nr:hypothetical protein A3781_06435 [Bacillus badius]